MKNYHLKFRLEVVPRGLKDECQRLSSFDVVYYTVYPELDSFSYDNVTSGEDICFHHIAEAIASEWIFVQCAASDSFLFGVEYFDIDGFFEHRDFDKELAKVIWELLNRTFDYNFFYESKLETKGCYEYIFNLTFSDVSKDLPLREEKVEVKVNKIDEVIF